MDLLLTQLKDERPTQETQPEKYSDTVLEEHLD